MFNPMIRGWLQYYGRFYRSALYPPMRQLDRSLARWAERKYKKLRGHLRRATHWVARISRRDPKLWAHWRSAWLHDGSRVSGDVQARFCERLEVRFPGPTHPVLGFQHREEAARFLEELRERLGKFELEMPRRKRV